MVARRLHDLGGCFEAVSRGGCIFWRVISSGVTRRLHILAVAFKRCHRAVAHMNLPAARLMWSPRKPRRQTPRALEEVAPLRTPVQAGRHQRHTRSKPEERPRPKGINQQCRLGWTTRHRCDGSLPVRSKPLPHRWRAVAVVMGCLSRLKVIAVNVSVLSAVVCFRTSPHCFLTPPERRHRWNQRPPQMRFCPGKNIDNGDVVQPLPFCYHRFHIFHFR